MLSAVLHDDGSAQRAIIIDLRVPRTVVGLVVGAALGVAGGLAQSLMRNPLADPGLLGISAGSAFAVVLAIYVFGVDALAGQVWFAIAGAALAGTAVYALGASSRHSMEMRLVIAGAAISGLLASATTCILISDQQTLDEFRVWVLGSLSGKNVSVTATILPFITLGLALAFAVSGSLNALSLGDDAARALGHHPSRTRATAAVAIVLLAAPATAAVGPIAFVGLAVPHVVRYFTGPDNRLLLPFCALVAPAVLLLADVVGRLVVRPGELQVGVVTAALGTPFFVALARRRRSAEI